MQAGCIGSEACLHGDFFALCMYAGSVETHHELKGKHSGVVLVLHSCVGVDAVEQHGDVVLVGLLAAAVCVEQLLVIAGPDQL